MRARAPAKVNLALAVGPRREDGYHELRGVFARLELADRMSMRSVGDRRADDGDVLRIAARRGAGPGSGEDLILRATRSLRARVGRPLPGLHVTLEKRIPVGAGLGGGSSDAATALRLASAAWGIELAADELIAIGRTLGSDVPFFLGDAPIALVEGTGERVAPLPSTGVAGCGVLLACGAAKPSTAEVFADLDGQPRTAAGAVEATDRLVGWLRDSGGAGTRVGLVDLAATLRDANDLYPAAARVTPGLAALRARIEAALGRPALLSGAGATLFVLYASADEAGEAATALQPALDDLGRSVSRPVRLIATAFEAEA